MLNIKPTLNLKSNNNSNNNDEDDEIGDGLRTIQPTTNIHTHLSNHLERTNSLPFIPGQVERRRRKLPEIPKNKRCMYRTD